MPRTLAAFSVLFVAAAMLGCGGEKPKEKAESKTSNEPLTTVVDTPQPGTKTPPKPRSTDPDPGDATPEAALTVGLAVRNLTSNEADERYEAVVLLAQTEYDPEIGEEVAAGLVRRLADVEERTRDAAVGALKKWARTDDVEAIAALLTRSDKAVRHRAITVLSGLATDASARHVASRITSAFDRENVRVALIDMGAITEPVLLEMYVEDPDAEVRLAVVKVLHEVGGRESIEPLIEMQGDPDPRVATAAARALTAVETR